MSNVLSIEEQARQGFAQLWEDAHQENRLEIEQDFMSAIQALGILEGKYGIDISDMKAMLRWEMDDQLGEPEVKGYPGDANHDADGMLYYEDETSICLTCSATVPSDREMCDQCKQDFQPREAA